MSPSTQRQRLATVLAGAAATAVLSFACAAAARERGRTVYYQVSYANGEVRELSAVPRTRQGIRRVLRIVRVQQGSQGYEILSTGPQTLTLVNRGQTYKTDLAWNGKAWVAPTDPPPPPATKPATDTGASAAARQLQLLRARIALIDLARKLVDSQAALMGIEDRLRDPNQAAAARKAAGGAVARARQEIRACLQAVLDADRKLRSPAAEADAAPVGPTGKVTPAPAGPAGPFQGIVRPVQQVAALPFRARVWRLSAARGERALHASIAHPEAGDLGAFYYVAYADTNADGRPDRLLARSPLARAATPGAWTQWTFTTAEPHVFVGQAWTRPETSHYVVEAVRIDDNWRGLSPEVYVSASPWGLPARRRGRCFGNVRVWSGRPGARREPARFRAPVR